MFSKCLYFVILTVITSLLQARFSDTEYAPDGPPLNVTVTAESSPLLLVTWEPPEKDKRNGMIVNYTVCVSHRKYEPCFKECTTKETKIVVKNLIDSSKYYIRVLASTRVGSGPYSESRGKFTNGKQPEMSTNGTASTLTFFLPIIPIHFMYFSVVVLELKDEKQGRSPSSYENNELVTYSEAEQSTDPKPYIAAILTSMDKKMFILGDGRYTHTPTLRRRRSTSCGYYNGPLKPDTSYIIFKRIFINNKAGDYYSTDWSSPSKTSNYSEDGEKCAEQCAEQGTAEEHLVGIIVVVVLLVISLAIIAYLTYKLKSPKPNMQHIYENPDRIQDDANYANVQNEQPMNREDNEKENRFYAYLNDVRQDYKNQEETVM